MMALMRLSQQLLESVYVPPSPAALKKKIKAQGVLAKKNIKKQKPVYDATKRYRIDGVVKDLVPQCQVCGTPIRRCVILFDDLSHEQLIVGSQCAAIMLNWTLGKVERKAQQVQQERDKEAEKAEWDRVYKDKNYELLKRFYSQWLRDIRNISAAGEAGSQIDIRRWSTRFARQLGVLVKSSGMSEKDVLKQLDQHGWRIDDIMTMRENPRSPSEIRRFQRMVKKWKWPKY